jgi:hypothetical protein
LTANDDEAIESAPDRFDSRLLEGHLLRTLLTAYRGGTGRNLHDILRQGDARRTGTASECNCS